MTKLEQRLPYKASKKRLFLASSLHILLHRCYALYRRGGKPRPDYLPEIVVSTRHLFVYCGVPLVATQTFLDIFIRRPRILGASLHRKTLQDILALNPEFGAYLKFGIVRNPWSRVVSCYEKVIRNAYSKEKLFSIRTVKDIGQICLHRGLHPQMCFNEFVEWLCSEEGSDNIANRHWMSQYRFLVRGDGDILCDVLLRLENLKAELKPLLEKLNIHIGELPTKNATANMVIRPQHRNFKDYYNVATANAIGDRYHRDIELFDYHF